MQIITTRRDGSAVAKPFSWSYSRLKNFEACALRHKAVDIDKEYREDESEQLAWGDTVHKGAAKRLKDKSPLPAGLALLEPWCRRIEGNGAGVLLVEQKLAIASDYGPCDWFAKGNRPAWFRGVADAIKLVGDVALAIDWKTGKILEDSVQLALMAQCIFSHHPQIQKIRTEFIWLKEDATSRADFSRDDMVGLWRELLPRVQRLKDAHDTGVYPAMPGRLCRKWCPVQKCDHFGQRA